MALYGNLRINRNLGSAGWSDIGDFDIETSPSEEKKQSSTGNQSRKEKEGSPSKTNPADIMEVARLRAQLKRLEADLDQAKLVLSILLVGST